jgi:hypothetical protein
MQPYSPFFTTFGSLVKTIALSLVFIFGLGSPIPIWAEDSIQVQVPAPTRVSDSAFSPDHGFSYHGYGTVNYQYFDFETDLSRRSHLDLERIALEMSVRLKRGLRLDAEVEVEHGGTGSSMEFDRLEEFGEFESEIEKGGEISIENFALVWNATPRFTLMAGHIFVPVGLAAELDEPVDYFTVLRSETESALLPTLWHENGMGLTWQYAGWQIRTVLVNGLDGSAFSSAHWIAPGHQGRFENVNADNMALAARLDWHHGDLNLGMAGYSGNTTDNRPKPDLNVPSRVILYDIHAQSAMGPFMLRALLLHGFLENSAAVSRANRQLSNALQVKRTPVGSQALGAFAEIGCDVLAWWQNGWQQMPRADAMGLWVYGRYDYYDTMFRTADGIFDNARWERSAITSGVNFKPIRAVVLKGEMNYRQLGTPQNNTEITYAAGLGVLF